MGPRAITAAIRTFSRLEENSPLPWAFPVSHYGLSLLLDPIESASVQALWSYLLHYKTHFSPLPLVFPIPKI